MADHVFAASTCAIRHGGATIRLRIGDAWPASDPVVQANPGLFSEQPTAVKRSVPAVEQATAAPGEKRGKSRA